MEFIILLYIYSLFYKKSATVHQCLTPYLARLLRIPTLLKSQARSLVLLSHCRPMCLWSNIAVPHAAPLNCTTPHRILHTQISLSSFLWNLYAATSTVYLDSHYYAGCVVSGYFIWQVAGKILTDLLTAEVQINFQSANVHFSTFHSSFPLANRVKAQIL